MRSANALACLVLLVAVRAGADEPLRIAGAALGPDGVLTRRTADVMGHDGPSHTVLLVVEAPALHGASRISGRVEAFEIDPEAWLELAAVFPDGHREVARTLDASDPAAPLHGTAAPRRFALAVPAGRDGAQPVRLELGVGMLGPGVVSVSELRLETGPAPAAATGRRPWLALAVLVPIVLGAGALLRRVRGSGSRGDPSGVLQPPAAP
ncbi:MAG: hypothetical protein OZ948_02415 [Deltaproteobacteria bacterium]|nr:hypothetical protein [Deltaproteobacteria bacterium]